MKKKYMILVILISILTIIFAVIYFKTGILQYSKINNRDSAYWNYTEEGIIKGAREFILAGNEETCWLLVHGYTSTPDEMKELAFRINYEFNETVIVPRLKGHGEMPSEILNLTLENWYEQIRKEYVIINLKCNNVNVVGFSFGGALGLKLAEEEQINNLYLIAPYLKARYKWFRILPLETYMDMFADIAIYAKKSKIAQINSPEGLSNHIAYWNMPLIPPKNSDNFIKNTFENSNKINNSVLIQHSINDETADVGASRDLFKKIISNDKQIIYFEDSNHVLTEDYDKQEVINNIITFEKERRTYV